MIIYLIHHTLHHIPEEHWNNRFKLSDSTTTIKYGYPTNLSDPIVVVDQAMFDYYDTYKNAYGLILEPPCTQPLIYKNIIEIQDKFKCIFTHNKKLIDLSSKFSFYPHGDCYIENYNSPVKNKLVSLIASNKSFAPGHILRHDIIRQLYGMFDLFGKGYNPIEKKEPALMPYKFSIVMENSKEDYYFTEKLIDCIRCKTIPIYWGCPSIDNFFCGDSILKFDTISELNNILNNISSDLYDSLTEQIEYNYYQSFKYDTHFTTLKDRINR